MCGSARRARSRYGAASKSSSGPPCWYALLPSQSAHLATVALAIRRSRDHEPGSGAPVESVVERQANLLQLVEPVGERGPRMLSPWIR